MQKNLIKICEAIDIEKDGVKIRQASLNELMIALPLEGFRVQITAPLFSIETFSPANITLVAITSNEFLIIIVTPGGILETLVPSLVLEVFNPEGMRIFRVVAPPE